MWSSNLVAQRSLSPRQSIGMEGKNAACSSYPQSRCGSIVSVGGAIGQDMVSAANRETEAVPVAGPLVERRRSRWGHRLARTDHSRASRRPLRERSSAGAGGREGRRAPRWCRRAAAPRTPPPRRPPSPQGALRQCRVRRCRVMVCCRRAAARGSLPGARADIDQRAALRIEAAVDQPLLMAVAVHAHPTPTCRIDSPEPILKGVISLHASEHRSGH